MSNNEAKVIMIFRLLTPKHRAALLSWVHLAYAAENSAGKSLSSDTLADIKTAVKQQKRSYDSLQRNKK